MQQQRASSHLRKKYRKCKKTLPFRHPLLKLFGPALPALFLCAAENTIEVFIGLRRRNNASLAFVLAICEPMLVRKPRGSDYSMSSGENALETNRKFAIPGLNRHPLALFFREFCRNPTKIGSIIPSSNRLIDRMLSRIDWDTTRIFVEYGPGVGTFTRPILERLAPEARLVVIDTNPSFIRYLQDSIKDPRLILVEGSATEINAVLANHGLGQADYVLSGLPFSTLPPGIGPAIMRETHAALRPGGAFVIYQYALKVMRLLAPYFATIDRDFEPLNIPPAQVFWAWKD